MASDSRHGRTRADSGAAKAALRDLVVEKVADKAAEKASKQERIAQRAARKAASLERAAGKVSDHAARHERVAAKAAMKAEMLERISSGLGALELWTRDEPGARRPRFTRDDIAQAAMRIADTEGFDALSMRRLAVELDAGTMTLYHYVRTKDEVLTLLLDAVMAEVVLGPDEPMPASWREAMTTIAERSRASVQRHAWILDIADEPALGPNAVRHFDQSLEAVASLPISLAEKIDIVSAVDEYVFGFCLSARDGRHADDADTGMIEYVESLVATGEYPQLAALAAEYGLDAAWEQIEEHRRDPDRFARNLRRLLDGIEADLPGGDSTR
ncbi:MAG TPA: TetR/AcrR family transcriptional regulator C-terminal domain-containing protein [Acidimicrobiia bacterium]